MDTLKTLHLVREPPVVRIKIARPEANNSINADLTRELLQALREAEADEALRIVVIEGDSKTFCSGLDFRDFSTGRGDAGLVDEARVYYEVLKAITLSPRIVVAYVTGKANAGGVGFVAACDLVIAGPGATFSLSEVLFGLLPACVLPFLIRRTGFQRAQQLALTAQPIAVEEAHRWGLVDEWDAQPEQLLRRRIPRLARTSPAAVARLKQYMHDLWIVRDETRDLAVRTIADLLGDEENQAKIRRFVNEGVLPWQV